MRFSPVRCCATFAYHVTSFFGKNFLGNFTGCNFFPAGKILPRVLFFKPKYSPNLTRGHYFFLAPLRMYLLCIFSSVNCPGAGTTPTLPFMPFNFRANCILSVWIAQEQVLPTLLFIPFNFRVKCIFSSVNCPGAGLNPPAIYTLYTCSLHVFPVWIAVFTRKKHVVNTYKSYKYAERGEYLLLGNLHWKNAFHTEKRVVNIYKGYK